MEVISSKSFEDDSSEGNINEDYYKNKINNVTNDEEDDEEFENNLNEMEMNGINEIDELDEENEESENKIENGAEEHYEENEISNSVENVENNTINTIDEENDENSNNNENNNSNDYKDINMQNIQIPFIVPLIIFQNDKYIISEETKKIFGEIGNNKIGIISLYSNEQFKNDKFKIINKLFRKNIINNNNYYDKNNKSNILLYSQPLILKNNNDYFLNNKDTELPCFIIDLNFININNENDDYRLILITILISSIFLFISEDIDEDSFNFFDKFLNLIKIIKIKNFTEEDNNELKEFLPNLFWVLLNSNLKLEDNNGNTITEKQYMDNCLKMINSNNDSVEESNRIKRGIKNYFKERDCFPLMNNNNDIFNADINNKNFKNKIFKKVKPKSFFGHSLSGNMILELIESVLNSINSGASPIIYNSWEYIMKKEFLKYANDLISKFSTELKQYRDESISKKQFFDENQIEKYKIKILEKYMNEYLTNNIINEDTKLEYKEKIKSKLEIELRKFDKENEKYFEGKFIKELNLLSNKFMENFTSSNIYEKNSYKFFQDFEDFRNIAVQKTPDFPKKNEILFDKVLLIIKKFINGKIMKIKVINDEKNYLDKENKKQDNKIEELNRELNLIKNQNSEFIQKINNEIKNEKRKNKRIEDKMNRLINNKNKEIDNLKKSMELEISNYEKKINEIIESNKNLDKEIKIKGDQLIVMKMNNDKISSLYGQKSSYLEREITSWKDKYNSVIKEALEKQNELNKENIKLKEQNRLLMKNENKNVLLKENKNRNEIENKRINNNASNNSNTKNNSMNNTIRNKNIKGNINGLMKYIKMNFKDKKNQMLKLDKYFNNKKMQNQDSPNKETKKEETLSILSNTNSNTINVSDKQNSTSLNNNTNSNEFYTANKENIKKFSISINSSNLGNNNNTIYVENKSLNKTEISKNAKDINENNNNNGKETYLNNKNNNNESKNLNNFEPEKLKIKIVKGRIRKDKNGKPYLEYIININYDNNKNWNISRRFNQFTNLYKTLRTISKENFELPKSSNIFSNITSMFSGLSHENKIMLLEKYLKDLTEAPEINNSKHLYFFLELNHLYEIN